MPARTRPVVVVALCAICLRAVADDTSTSLAAVEVTGTAETQKPDLGRVSTELTRPQSLLTRQAIDTLAPKFSDFGTLANLLPSFVSSAPNGNGFDAAKSMTLRGFPDGQFNVTLDGIPFADPDGFGHHSTSIFPASSIEQLSIDRSPGSGASLGYSGTGGSLNLTSLAIPSRRAAELYGAYGSFATSQAGVLLHNAAPTQDGQTGVLLNVQHLQSDGAMAHAMGRRDDLLLKSESLFAGLKLTLLYSYDDYHYFNPPSVTTDQLGSAGSGVGFSLNRASPDFNEYAKTDRVADIGYARLQATPGEGLRLTETVYTYAYRNRGLSPNGDITSAKSYQVGGGFGVVPTDIAGRLSATAYRTLGNIVQVEREDDVGSLRAGLWLEHSHLTGNRNAIDLTTNTLYNANVAAASPALFDYRAKLDVIAPYADYDWRPTASLDLRAGLRYQAVRRRFDASVVPSSRPGTGGEVSRSVHNLLPSVEGNYALAANTHAYLQWARGALVPNQSFFYTNRPALGNQAQPQSSEAVQGGIVYSTDRANFSIDVYQINLRNYVSQITDSNKNTLFVNNGQVRYRGVEVEANGELGLGLTAVLNGSLIRAQFRNDAMATATQRAGDTIPLVPSYTGLLGLLYRQSLWSGGVLMKFIGTEYQGAGGSADGPDRRIAPYHYINLTATRALDDLLGQQRHATVSLQVSNLENRTPITDSAGRAAVGPGGPLLMNVLARRGFTLSFRSDL